MLKGILYTQVTFRSRVCITESMHAVTHVASSITVTV